MGPWAPGPGPSAAGHRFFLKASKKCLIACYVARPLVEYGIDAMCRCGAIGQQLLVLSLVVAAPLCCGCDHEMVLVGGYGKCGTSHLNSILASHPRIVSLTKDGMAQIPWLEWSEMLLHLRRVACSAHGQTKAMLRSCEKMFPMKQDVCQLMFQRAKSADPGSEAVLVHTAKIPQQPSFQVLGSQVKVIKLLRDPADWLWAAYNYFSSGADAGHPGSHTEMEFHYRSPEHFHEIVLSGGKLRGLNKHVETSAGDLRSLAEQLGPRLLVMKSEDLSKWSFLAKLAAFVNVPVRVDTLSATSRRSPHTGCTKSLASDGLQPDLCALSQHGRASGVPR
eukprot:s7306_g4.t1